MAEYGEIEVPQKAFDTCSLRRHDPDRFNGFRVSRSQPVRALRQEWHAVYTK